MVAEETELIKKTKEYAGGILKDNVPEAVSYHNMQHTKDVVDAAIEIGKASDLSEEEMEIVQLAAWLHDVGYCEGANDHEDMSIEMTRNFLSKMGVEPAKIEAVEGCIEATKMPQRPQNKLQEVICDADLYHLASNEYFNRAELLREELEITKGMELSQLDWYQMNIQFFGEHEYFTEYAKEKLTPQKNENLKKVKKKVKELKSGSKYTRGLEKELKKLKAKIDADRENKPTRGIETMFRITSKNHLQLSAMADNKANIMISINSIILSILVTVLTRKLDDSPHLIVPALILTVVCLLTIVFAVLATRPNVSSGMFTTDDILNKRTNLLFFGNFHGMQVKDYVWGMKEMMNDADYLYSSLIKDIYFLGIVLGKKYKLLRISYTIFMYGFVMAVLSFVVASILTKQA
ncbi:DUF5706 domain-containing protein [Fulvivirgaceae bacterium BMA10]|uniref:DUF5706 domain-containing protein n=1 Tax=Splendidivirga corallicola TaxID=3051826 RepID=A0ABT8KT20_9BACT|nr:DUF5706 domain-containing protein [Fulvivirgaceae bacterium BMA10]